MSPFRGPLVKLGAVEKPIVLFPLTPALSLGERESSSAVPCAELDRSLVAMRSGSWNGLADGYPAVRELAIGLVQRGGDGIGQGTNLRCLESLQIVEEDAGMLLAVRYAQLNPARECGTVLGHQRPRILPAGFQQDIVCRIKVSSLLPGGHMLHIHVGAQQAQSRGQSDGHVRIQQQPGVQTRRNE